jgi:serine protease AprX
MEAATNFRPVVVVSILALFCSALIAQEATLRVVQDGPLSRIVVESGGAVSTVRVTEALVANGAVRMVAASPFLAATWDEIDAGAASSAPYYALSLDGKKFHPAVRTSYDLMLRYRRFDPLAGEPQVPAQLRAPPSSKLWIVQYWTQGVEEYRDVVRALGGEVHLFLPNCANVVEADAAAMTVLRTQPFVRWIGAYHPAYKIEEVLVAEQTGSAAPPATRRLNLLTMRRGAAGHEPVNAAIAAAGGRLHEESPETSLLSADLTADQTLELARLDSVQWIDLWSAPENDMDIARDFHGANYVETQGGFIGTGVRGEVLDDGCDTTHPDLAGYILHGANAPSSHGTCTAGIVFGSGLGNPAARGGMPAGQLVIADYTNVTNRYNHTAELQNPALVYKCVLQSNSWGSNLTTAYTSISQDMDTILFDFQRISILNSQSNAGTQSSRPQAWAKNIISVGGIRHQNTLTKADDTWTNGASIGPAADGRLKPDIASFYDNVHCTDRPGAAGYSGTSYYTGFNGTSSATPICAGHVGLLYEMWHQGVFGNPHPNATVFENRPNNTTMKALVINTATQWTFTGATADLTRTHQGWGHPDLKTAWDLRNNMYIVDETDVLVNLASTVHSLTVPPGTPALKATMVYRDRPGTTSATLHRINNMDLKVTSPGGTIYWGNNGLAANMWSTSGGTPNGVDTVENVFVQNPASGTWLVEVIAAEINQDTHIETPAVDGDYALVVTGIQPGPPPPTVANFSATPLTGPAPLQVTFSDTSTGGPTSWAWTFGDGGTATSQNPVYTYAAQGTYTVSLNISGPLGNSGLTKNAYIVVGPPVPSITTISPANVQAFLGGTITITGVGFTGATQVQVGATLLAPVAGFTIVNDTTITLTAPAATALGPVPVTVTTPVGTSAPGGFTYVETNPAKLSCPVVTLTGTTFTWNFGGGANDTGVIIVATSPTTYDFGTPYQILLNFQIIAYPLCNGAGIGSQAVAIPPGYSGVTFYSQVASVDEVTNLFTVSNIISTYILF